MLIAETNQFSARCKIKGVDTRRDWVKVKIGVSLMRINVVEAAQRGSSA